MCEEGEFTLFPVPSAALRAWLQGQSLWGLLTQILHLPFPLKYSPAQARLLALVPRSGSGPGAMPLLWFTLTLPLAQPRAYLTKPLVFPTIPGSFPVTAPKRRISRPEA